MMECPSIMIVDDAEASYMFTSKVLKRKWPNADITTEQLPYCSLITMSIESPDVLIFDYEFKNYNILEEKEIIKRLLHFKGLVIIYSAHEIKDIMSCFNSRFGHVPKNFRILNKRNPLSLVTEIIKYQSRKDNDVKYPANP